ncbi:regulator of G-protein signaling 22 isoform X2 [Hydra vulgaris]
MCSKDGRFESQKTLEETLKNDALFLEYFNAYLCLPVFPKRLLLKNEVFEEAKCKYVGVEKNGTSNYVKYSIKFLEKEPGFKWIMVHRLTLFLQSTLFAEYSLAKLLFSNHKKIIKKYDGFHPLPKEWQEYNKIFSEQPVVSGNQNFNNIMNHCDASKKYLKLLNKQFFDSFKDFLYETAGESLMLLWIDIETLKHLPCLQRERCLHSIKELFFSSGSTFKIPYETLKSWGIEGHFSYENLILVQKLIFNPILTYWLPRFMFHYLLGKGSSFGVECSNIQYFNCFQNGYDFKHSNMFYYPNNVENTNCQFLTELLPLKVNGSMFKSALFENKGNLFFVEKKLSYFNSLIEMLQCEKVTGYYFLNYLEKVNNSFWQNCYLFWKSVQQYHDLFFSSSFSPDSVKKKVNYIYSIFICPMSKHDLKLPEEVNKIIYDKLDPPYEDLFDNVEQEVLLVLLLPFVQLIENENLEYEMLVIHERFDYIHDENTSDLNSKVQSKIEKECFKSLLEIGMQTNHDKQENDDFIQLLKNEDSRRSFQIFLETNHKIGFMDLMAYIDMQDYVNISDLSYKDTQALYISQKWFNENYFLGSNSPAPLEIVKNLLLFDEKVSDSIYQVPNELAIIELQKYVYRRLEHFYLNMKSNKYLQNAKDDLPKKIIVSKKKNQIRYLNQQSDIRFNENSCEVKAFRNALNEPNMCALFKKFINIHYSELEKNLDFWLEVQKYKYLCHRHVDDHIIENKFRAIVDVFIQSSVPPTLQIDITHEIANELLSRKSLKKAQPYVFREAQAEVFRILFSAWADFDLYRTSGQFNLKFQNLVLTLKTDNKEREKLNMESWNNENKPIETKAFIYKNEMKLKKREYSNSEYSSDGTSESQTATFIYSKHMAEERSFKNLTKVEPIEALKMKTIKVSKIKDITNLTNYTNKVPSNKDKSCSNGSVKLPFIQKLRTTRSSVLSKGNENVKRLPAKRLPKPMLPEVIVS